MIYSYKVKYTLKREFNPYIILILTYTSNW